MAQVKIYTMKHCPFCEMAKRLCKTRSILFEEILVPMDAEAEWERLYKLTGMRTMPQIFCGDRLIGGYDQLADLDRQDQLESLK